MTFKNRTDEPVSLVESEEPDRLRQQVVLLQKLLQTTCKEF